MDSIETELLEDPSKRDTRGRRIVKETERERLIAEYERSGLTQKEFCRREGINYHTFVGWLGKRRRNGEAAENETPLFQEVVLSGHSGYRAGLEVQLPGGEVIRGHDAESVAKLVELLRG
jgi:transposase-like protein